MSLCSDPSNFNSDATNSPAVPGMFYTVITVGLLLHLCRILRVRKQHRKPLCHHSVVILNHQHPKILYYSVVHTQTREIFPPQTAAFQWEEEDNQRDELQRQKYLSCPWQLQTATTTSTGIGDITDINKQLSVQLLKYQLWAKVTQKLWLTTSFCLRERNVTSAKTWWVQNRVNITWEEEVIMFPYCVKRC